MNPLFAVMANIPSSFRQDSLQSPLCYVDQTNVIMSSDLHKLYHHHHHHHHHHKSSFAHEFLKPSNIEYIRKRIEYNVRNYINDSSIIFLLTTEFAQYVFDMLHNNPSFSIENIDFVNETIIDRETEIAILSERQKKRYTKWELQNDRMKTMPYGYSDKTNHVKGETVISPSGYHLNHPYQHQYKEFLKSVYNIQTKK
jgi:hypothetical protein